MVATETENATRNPLTPQALAYFQHTAARTGRELVPGWQHMLTGRLQAALGQVGTFASPLHGRLWLDSQASDLMMLVDDE